MCYKKNKKIKIRGTTLFPLPEIKTQNRNTISSPKLRNLGVKKRSGSIVVWSEIERKNPSLRERTWNWEIEIERDWDRDRNILWRPRVHFSKLGCTPSTPASAPAKYSSDDITLFNFCVFLGIASSWTMNFVLDCVVLYKASLLKNIFVLFFLFILDFVD